MNKKQSDTYDELWAEIQTEWRKAEGCIKDAEQVCLKLIEPAVLELRYAGRKLVEAQNLKKTDPEGAISLLRDARHDCARAQHDAVDSAVLTVGLQIKNIQDKIPAKAIIAVYPQYAAMRSNLRKMHKKIVEARKYREKRDELYMQMREIEFASLREAYDDFSHSEDLMRQIGKGERRQKTFAYGVGASGVGFGVISNLSEITTLLSGLF